MQLPFINPTLLKIGPLEIRWYALAYIFGIILAWLVVKYFNKKNNIFNEKEISDDFFTYAVISIIIGGRLGYVLFYNFSFYITHPIEILKVWHGGMSFHGGLLGVIVGSYYLCKKHKIDFFEFCDLLAIASPIGLFFGRIANFINLELYGRITDSKFGIIFPNAGDLPRHPSQLYEAFLEGICLFCIIFFIAKKISIKKYKGLLSGMFLCGYGLSRFIVEFFREPDVQIGYILKYFTMGQLLTLPIFALGVFLIVNSIKNGKKSTLK